MSAFTIQKVGSNGRFIALFLIAFFSVSAQERVPLPGNSGDSLSLIQNYRLFSGRLSALLTQTVENNRSMKAAQSRIREADAAVIATIGQAPPQFEIAAMDASFKSFPNPLRDQMRMEYSIEQMLMYPGKLSTMRRIQLKQKEMTEFEVGAREQAIVYKVKAAFYELYLIDRLVAINYASQMLITNIIEIARVRYEAGTGMMPDILRAQTELATLSMRVVELERKRLGVAAMINALRAFPMETVIDTLPEIRPPIFRLSLDTLKSVVLEKKPDVQVQRASIGMKKEELAVAKLEWYPDFSVRTTYADIRPVSAATDPMSIEFGTAKRNNPDRWSIMLGMTIPEVPWVLKKAKAQRLRAQAAIESAEEELAEMVNMISGELFRTFADVQSNARRLQITTASVLPQAQLAFESTLSSYTNGNADFTMLFDAQRTLLMAREEYHMIVMAYLASLAALDYASGSVIDATSDKLQRADSNKSSGRIK